MRDFLFSGRFLLLDMASTVFFLVIYLATGSLRVAVILGIGLGVSQIALEFVRRKPIDTMQWVSLVIVVASGTAALVTNDPRFIMVKLSLIYLFIGLAMCKPGWMDRYLPPTAKVLVPDIGRVFGFAWAGLMFFSAAFNLVVAMTCTVAVWGSVMTVFGLASKLTLFLINFGTMRLIGRSRARASAVTAA